MTALKKKEKDPLADAAKKALESAKGDVLKATKAFEQTIRGNRNLRDQLLEPLIASACYDAIRKQSHVERKQIWKPATTKVLGRGATNGSIRVVQLAAGNLMMFPLPGGKPLGEATREQITEAAQFYGSQSADMGHKARWLQLIAQSVPGDKKVSDVLTDERLRELQDAARE